MSLTERFLLIHKLYYHLSLSYVFFIFVFLLFSSSKYLTSFLDDFSSLFLFENNSFIRKKKRNETKLKKKRENFIIISLFALYVGRWNIYNYITICKTGN